MTTVRYETLSNGYSVSSRFELKTNKSIRLYGNIAGLFVYLVTDNGMKSIKKQYNCILETVKNY
jgi:hypothetical protein